MPLQSATSLYQHPPAPVPQPSSGSSNSGIYIPHRSAPNPPPSSESQIKEPEEWSDHVRPGGNKRLSGAQRSSYVPSSRPPYATASSSTSPPPRTISPPSTSSSGQMGGPNGASYQLRRPTPPVTRVIGGPSPSQSFNGPYSATSSSSSPSNQTSKRPTPSPQNSGSSGGPGGLGGTWEFIDDVPSNSIQQQPHHLKRPAPPPLTSSLRDIADSLPTVGASSRSTGSTNSSNSSLIVHPPTNNSQNSHHNSTNKSHHQPSQSLQLSQSLLTDPATAAAAGMAMGDEGWSPHVHASNAQSQQQYQQQQQWAGSGAAGAPPGRRSNEQNQQSRAQTPTQSQFQSGGSSGRDKEKGSTIKGVLGSFLGSLSYSMVQASLISSYIDWSSSPVLHLLPE